MARKHRRPNYSVYADEDSSRELKVFVSSLVIGICIGAFAFYFFVERPHVREIVQLKAEVAALQARQPVCPPARGLQNGQREELESRLSNCNSSLERLRRATESAAQQAPAGDGPPLPKPPPGRAVDQPVAPASVMPPADLAPDDTGITPPTEPTPPNTSAAPSPASTTIAPPNVVSPTPFVWPQNWPPKPRRSPPRPTGTVPTVETIGTGALGTISGPTTALAGAQTVTLDVGDERDVSGYHIRLIAISRRNSGRYCIVGGNGMVSQRIATGSSKRVSWNGHNVTLQATVRDGDTCQIALKPG